MATASQAFKFVDGETEKRAAVPEHFRDGPEQLLNLTGDEIDCALHVLEEVQGDAAPISGLRPVVATTVSQLSWELAEMRRLLQAIDTGLAPPFAAGESRAISMRKKLRADWHALVQEQLGRVAGALRELQNPGERSNPKLEQELAMSIALLKRELENAW